MARCSVIPIVLLLAVLSFTVMANPGKVVVKRSDDPVLEVAVMNQLVTEVQTLKASLAALQNSLVQTNKNVARLDTNVAFMAGFQEYDVTGYHSGMTVKYTRVPLNTGNGYDALTGIFTAPVSGLYAFGAKLETLAMKPVSLELIHEGTSFGHVYGDDETSYEMSSTLELRHVNKGERVWIQVGIEASQFRGTPSTDCLGVLLHAD